MPLVYKDPLGGGILSMSIAPLKDIVCLPGFKCSNKIQKPSHTPFPSPTGVSNTLF
ncbi:MAG TPA: hypothetical protein VHJ38_04030 [Nitrososphaeraceae archaeon]|nr:hypothetical protein [Nitrososphaeraceae archaeon]